MGNSIDAKTFAFSSGWSFRADLRDDAGLVLNKVRHADNSFATDMRVVKVYVFPGEPDKFGVYQTRSYVLGRNECPSVDKHMSLEIGYVGRMGHSGIIRQDFSQPLTNFRDPQSGTTWTQASGILRAAYSGGLTAAQVRANPGLLAKIPFFENIFAKATNYKFTGSATANYFNAVYGTYAGSDLDALNDMDRLRSQPNNGCISAPGCNTFFALQRAGLTSCAG